MANSHPFKPFGRSPEKIPVVLDLHSKGLNNIQIAKQVSCSLTLVSMLLKQHGLRGNGNKEIEIVGERVAKCKRCGEIKSFDDFPRRTTKSQLPRGAYCKPCYRIRLNHSLNCDLERLFSHKLTSIAARCKGRNIQFNISPQYVLSLWNQQNGKCFYTDTPLHIGYGKGRKPNSVSMDRIDPYKGYIEGNVVLACDRINLMKQDATLEEMALWMPDWHLRITNYLRRAA